MKVNLLFTEQMKEFLRSPLLSAEQRSFLVLAVLEYDETGMLPDFTGYEDLKMSFIYIFKANIDENKKKYQAKCEKNRINGSKGGMMKAKGSNRYQTVSNGSERRQSLPKEGNNNINNGGVENNNITTNIDIVNNNGGGIVKEKNSSIDSSCHKEETLDQKGKEITPSSRLLLGGISDIPSGSPNMLIGSVLCLDDSYSLDRSITACEEKNELAATTTACGEKNVDKTISTLSSDQKKSYDLLCKIGVWSDTALEYACKYDYHRIYRNAKKKKEEREQGSKIHNLPAVILKAIDKDDAGSKVKQTRHNSIKVSKDALGILNRMGDN